jgi:hypothetical protein
VTYEEFILAIKAIIFPDREASNLVAVHDKYILDALIEIQKRIPQLRQRNFNLYPFEDTFYRCMATVIDPKPDGPLIRLYTHTAADHCDAVYYQPTTREHIESLMLRAQSCGTVTPPTGPMVNGQPPQDYHAAEVATDKGWRAATGHYANIGDQVFVWPHLESVEKVIVEWQGVKQDYSEEDLVVFERDVQAVVELYVQAQAALREDCDTNRYNGLWASWQTEMAKLVWWYRTKYLLPEAAWRASGCDICMTQGTTPPTSGPGPGPGPGVFNIYVGNAGSAEPPPSTYSEDDIKNLDNTFPVPDARQTLIGDYEISRPSSNLNEWRIFCFPAQVWSGPVTFMNSGFPYPMQEMTDRPVVDGSPYRVFRTTGVQIGSMTKASGNPLQVSLL